MMPDDDDQSNRGHEPEHGVAGEQQRPQRPDPDPQRRPDPRKADEWRKLLLEMARERRPKREQVFPYLLVRAVPSGDRGARPVFPPSPFWESPDILLIDAGYDGPFDPSRLVMSPRAGRSYRVFVRVWNLGRVPAAGVHVMGWAVNPGFIGDGNQNDPYYTKNLIGGRWLELADRTRPECTALAELDRTWDIPAGQVGHYCLLAQAECPLDQASGALLPNVDRHVGQRNVEILAGEASPLALIGILGSLVPEGFGLDISHAGPGVLGNLVAWGGGAAVDEAGRKRELKVPSLRDLRIGVPATSSQHLLTALRIHDRTVVAGSQRLAAAATSVLGARALRGMFDRPDGARRLLTQLGPDRWAGVGAVTDEALGNVLAGQVGRLLGVGDDLRAASMARRLGGPPGAQHALRFVLSNSNGEVVGGYTIVVS